MHAFLTRSKSLYNYINYRIKEHEIKINLGIYVKEKFYRESVRCIVGGLKIN